MKVELSSDDVAYLREVLGSARVAIENSGIHTPETRAQSLARVEQVLKN
ncbi:hypothetical protein [Lysobacter sp. cf310]|nr:hypothetical protein [Lysobacter sp. cf310]